MRIFYHTAISSYAISTPPDKPDISHQSPLPELPAISDLSTGYER